MWTNHTAKKVAQNLAQIDVLWHYLWILICVELIDKLQANLRIIFVFGDLWTTCVSFVTLFVKSDFCKTTQISYLWIFCEMLFGAEMSQIFHK